MKASTPVQVFFMVVSFVSMAVLIISMGAKPPSTGSYTNQNTKNLTCPTRSTA